MTHPTPEEAGFNMPAAVAVLRLVFDVLARMPASAPDVHSAACFSAGFTLAIAMKPMARRGKDAPADGDEVSIRFLQDAVRAGFEKGAFEREKG